MGQFGIRSLFIAVTGCAVCLAFYPWPKIAETKTFEDITEHPPVVQAVIEELERMPGGCSLEELEQLLEKTGNVKVPRQHFKGFESYWAIDTGSSRFPRFVIAGNFARLDGSHLTHATVNIVESPGGGWRTIWLADYASETPAILPPKIRGQPNAGG